MEALEVLNFSSCELKGGTVVQLTMLCSLMQD